MPPESGIWEDRVMKRRPAIRKYRMPSQAQWVVREVMRGPGPLRGALEVLAHMKRDGLMNDFALGGGMASIRYTEAVFTYDLDVFYIPPSDDLAADPPAIYIWLKARGYQSHKEHMVIAGVPVQFLAVDALTREGVEHGTLVDVEGVKVKTMTAEHLLAIAVRTGRAKDRVRVEMLLDQGRVNRERLDAILGRHGLKKAFSAMLARGR